MFDQTEYNKKVVAAEERMKLDHPNLILMHCYASDNNHEFCGKIS
jgi:hypothetical protein